MINTTFGCLGGLDFCGAATKLFSAIKVWMVSIWINILVCFIIVAILTWESFRSRGKGLANGAVWRALNLKRTGVFENISMKWFYSWFKFLTINQIESPIVGVACFMNRNHFLGVVGLAWALLSPSYLCAASKPLPNVVFILADDLGYADLGCYGHPYAKTPSLDQLAKEGTRFTQFYVTGVTCCPSRTGFMTGRFPARFQKYPAGFGFGDQVTITELLKKQGYRTGHFGKWHIGPETEGVYGIDQYASGAGDKKNPRGRDAWLFDEAVSFIKKESDKPFYVQIWGHSTHYPVDTHPELVQPFKNIRVDRKDFSETMQHKFDECSEMGGDINESMRHYLGDVYSLDLNVGRVLKTLDELGLRDNTIVVFTSDHGPAPVRLGAKKDSKEFSANMLGYAGTFRGGKHQQYEGGVRVPFMIRWPGQIKAGRIDRKSVTSGIDWFPTLCAIAGVKKLPAKLDGENVFDLWKGQDRRRVKPLFWKTSSAGSAPAMREGKWKLHLNSKSKGGAALYDLSIDPSESKNLVREHPEVADRLSTRLRTWADELPDNYDKKDKKRKGKRRQ